MADNYKTLYDSSRELFLRYDQQEMIRHFHLAYDENDLYFHILGREARIERKTGVVTCGGEPVSFNAACPVYDILSRAEKRPTLSGEWVSITQLGGNVASRHVEILRPALAALNGRSAELCALCEKLGGEKRRQGDVSYILPLYDFFPVWVQFWEGDEEFPSRFRCLWDANTLDFMYYETTWYAHGYLTDVFTGKEKP